MNMMYFGWSEIGWHWLSLRSP